MWILVQPLFWGVISQRPSVDISWLCAAGAASVAS